MHSTVPTFPTKVIRTTYDNIRITANSIAVPHSKEINGAKIIIKPLSEPPHTGVLQYDSKIEIFVPGAVVDSAGNGLRFNIVWFYADTMPDLTALNHKYKPLGNSMDIP